MRRNICRILIIVIIILMIGVGKSYGVVSKDINKQITNWSSGGFTGWTEELTKEAKDDILANLQKDFNYKGNTINKEMKMMTKISVEEKKQTFLSMLPWVENEYTYTIRIRYRNR